MPLVFSVNGNIQPVSPTFEATLADKLRQQRDARLQQREQVPAGIARNAYQQIGEAVKTNRLELTAADLMTFPVQTLSQSDTVVDALKLMREKGFRHIPVISKTGTLEGIVSDRDLLRIPEGTPLKDVMTAHVLTATSETSVKEIARVLLGHRIGALPIINERGMLLGILTTTDILHAIVERAPLDLWA